MPQPENAMMIFISANALALVALAVVLGRYLQRVDQLERDVRIIQAGNSDVSLAKLTLEVAHLGRSFDAMQRQVVRFGDFIMQNPPKDRYEEQGT